MNKSTQTLDQPFHKIRMTHRFCIEAGDVYNIARVAMKIHEEGWTLVALALTDPDNDDRYRARVIKSHGMEKKPSDVGIWDIVIKTTLMDGVKIVSETKLIG